MLILRCVSTERDCISIQCYAVVEYGMYLWALVLCFDGQSRPKGGCLLEGLRRLLSNLYFAEQI